VDSIRNYYSLLLGLETARTSVRGS
jgi:hypothetical protein